MTSHGERVDDVVPGMAEAIEVRRRQLGIAKGELASLVGVSREALRAPRAGLRRSYDDKTIFGMARALRWPVDWYERLKSGEPPMDDNGDADPEIVVRLDEIEAELLRQKETLEEILRRLDARESR